MATNSQDLVAKVKNLVALAPVLGAILRPEGVLVQALAGITLLYSWERSFPLTVPFLSSLSYVNEYLIISFEKGENLARDTQEILPVTFATETRHTCWCKAVVKDDNLSANKMTDDVTHGLIFIYASKC